MLRDVLAQRIKELRNARGLSQEELADRIGLTPAALSNLETRRSLPSLSTLEAIARELGAPVSSFLEDRPQGEADALHQRVRRSLSILSLDDLRIAAALIEALAALRANQQASS